MLDQFIAGAAARLNRQIMPSDHMHGGNDLAYFLVGESALRVIAAGLAIAAARPPTNILDFACGSGRVLRWLRAGFPDAKLTASDLRGDSLDFCGEAFDAETFPSTEDLSYLALANGYDLIWVGSLFTHLREEDSLILLQKLADALTPEGVCFATFCGRYVMRNILGRRQQYVAEKEIEGFLADYAQTGYAFREYNGRRNIGVSLTSIHWMAHHAMRLRLRIVMISEHGWARHQDVLAFQRLPAAPT